jgi:hypothetical protein
MFNNTTSYPLLLIQSLDDTGILSSLIVTDEITRDAINRAKSYFLVFATVSSCLTFAIGPRLIDSEHAPEPQDDKEQDDDEENGNEEQDEEEQHITEETSLLEAHAHRGSVVFFPSKPRESSTTVIHDRRPSTLSKRYWKKLSGRTQWWLLFLYDFLNMPLIGAVLGTIIGLVPAIQRAFFNDTADGGIFSAWLTASLSNIGGLFVPLPVVVAGVSLYTSFMKAKTQDSNSGIPWLTTAFVLVIRFLIWPVLSIGVVYLLAKNTHLLADDPMLWFTMMLMPTGPPAMKLITMIEVSDAAEEDEHKIAKLLTVSGFISYP